MNYIHPTALIGPNVIMGDNNYFGPYCIIGYPAEHKAFWEAENGLRDIWNGTVLIGSNNKFTGHVTIDAGTVRSTYIGNNVWMLKHSHVGHDAGIGDDVVISCGAKIGGHAVIGEGCNIGLNAVIHQKQIIEPGCMIGMGAVVTKKLITQPNSKYVGNPARYLGPNVKP